MEPGDCTTDENLWIELEDLDGKPPQYVRQRMANPSMGTHGDAEIRDMHKILLAGPEEYLRGMPPPEEGFTRPHSDFRRLDVKFVREIWPDLLGIVATEIEVRDAAGRASGG